MAWCVSSALSKIALKYIIITFEKQLMSNDIIDIKLLIKLKMQ